MPPGLTIINAYISSVNVIAGVDSLLLPPTAPAWLLTDSMLLAIGFQDAGFNSPQGFKVSFQAILDCDYNGKLPTHNLKYHTYCLDTSLNDVDFQNTLDVGSHCSNCFTVTETADMDTVIALMDTVTFTITVCSNNDSAQVISLMELLPANFDTITYNLPLTDTLASDTCVVYTLTGVFTQGGACIDNLNTVQVISGTNTIQDSYCVTVYPDCFNWNYTFLGDSTYSSSLPSYSISNDTFFVEGVFFIDSSLTLTTCVVYVNTGGQIVVQGNATLNLDSTLVEGCDNMWSGIFLKTQSTVNIREHSTIKDADVAVYANNRTTHNILNSAIEDCIKGVYVPPNSGTLNAISSFIKGSRFGLFGSG